MLWETLERVNRARQQAMANPEYIKSAQAHQKALQQQSYTSAVKAGHKAASKKPKKLADIYQQVEFGSNPSGREH
ncbi:hypothetical protein [Vibrio panuliri]|uniref:Uncharacterized protein n=1 Tax=Vibrio panuliri TaxID=1381081 RepID=A0A1Q9HIX0_9VIBR|nr:hypothetical protein [Vibrio panuliri]KAB1454256.1 hypothetical protein F7O85_15325 [Vibrio panuliri]OLQ84246.1 hypothetical protein BIY20_17750 [Vibrio panuliri]OLQ90210.1 hypothetical protein BIY22_04205 [Vibrio panuliri]